MEKGWVTSTSPAAYSTWFIRARSCSRDARHALAACERRYCSDGSATAAWLTSSHA